MTDIKGHIQGCPNLIIYPLNSYSLRGDVPTGCTLGDVHWAFAVLLCPLEHCIEALELT